VPGFGSALFFFGVLRCDRWRIFDKPYLALTLLQPLESFLVAAFSVTMASVAGIQGAFKDGNSGHH
jgi:hypothetical protein